MGCKYGCNFSWRFQRHHRRPCPTSATFNFLLSLAAPHLHGVLVLVTGNKFFAGVVVTGDKFLLGVSNTGDKFIAGDNDTGEQLSPVTTTPAKNLLPVTLFSPVSLTPMINIHSRISPRIFEKIRNGFNGILRGLRKTDL
jgi:hypothetical protein